MRSRMVLALACAFAWLGVAYTAEKSAASMADAATKFVSSLTPEQRQKAAFAFESEERLKWHFIPTEMFPRNGLTVGEMTEAQRKLAHGLLQSGLSQRGYMTATAIMDLETVLNALESAQRRRDAAASRWCATRSATSFRCSARRHRAAPGDGAWKDTTSR